MKILLIGEYSRLHNSLKEGLLKLGHEVTIIGDGDGFKNYPVDILLKNRYVKRPLNILRKILYRLFKIDLKSISKEKQFNAYKNQLKGFDIVQLINERPFKTVPKTEKKLLNYIFENNKNVFLLSCGCDFPSVDYAMKKKFRYSILTPFFEGKVTRKEFDPILLYLENNHRKTHDYLYKNIKGVISSDIDYHIPLLGNSKYLGLIPNPININRVSFKANNPQEKIIIFHGINKANYYKKGNDFFEQALDIINIKYKDKVEIISTTDIPYNNYIDIYNKAHILLDMVYAYDQGYNALEAMAKGKVVFTGAEQEWLDYYGLEKNTVAINAEPNVDSIIKNLEWLINNPEQITIISKNARQFIEEKHNYINIAQDYITLWLKTTQIFK
ncbi:glycosyltransferase [Psychroserpens damuponensis]|uniref:glycosyltransferase n=1 Tax=Psychroserpens damuponensis TaxID=943936 RepID=UPI000591412E|nr:glycosyltransferase [Psychroserpens damuponensis]